LESVKQTNLELEKMDGIKRHFRYDYQEVGKYNPQYLINVEMERQRLGENHPLFLTQYRLLPLHGGGGFLNSTQRAQLQGDHSRQSHPSSPSLETYNSKLITHNSPVYVASIDLAGEAETGDDTYLQSLHPKQDSTVITIAELEFNAPSFDNPLLYNHCEGRNDIASASPFGERETERDFPSPILYATACPSSLPRIATRRQSLLDSLYSHSRASLSSIPAEAGIQSPSLQTYNLQPKTYNSPVLHIVEHYSWTGRKHPELYPQMIDLLKNVWHCRRIVVDATGIGQPVASFLRQALGSRVVPFTFTAQSKSELGFNLLAAINSGRLKMYAADNSPEYQEFWHQMEKAKSFYRPSRTLNFFLDPADGHDDFLMSLALLVQSGALYEPRVARARGSLSAFP
jgi:hypothetical protein